MLIEKRFLKYVSFDTQSDESSTTSPSTEKQFDLADFLSEEMQILGVDEVERTDPVSYTHLTLPTKRT